MVKTGVKPIKKYLGNQIRYSARTNLRQLLSKSYASSLFGVSQFSTVEFESITH